MTTNQVGGEYSLTYTISVHRGFSDQFSAIGAVKKEVSVQKSQGLDIRMPTRQVLHVIQHDFP
ncbi:hypothetical protein BIV23_29885 [Streptomyces monashensis]|uniref:Uncharacterized protein n=1 Tax=Streptomyces monashensis TaxID=1678012 RepID=A0A1S2PWH5_9ACTN|nr:hypothetical protein BIV23_29885 [Streptomyces monashensis]